MLVNTDDVNTMLLALACCEHRALPQSIADDDELDWRLLFAWHSHAIPGNISCSFNQTSNFPKPNLFKRRLRRAKCADINDVADMQRQAVQITRIRCMRASGYA